jgi:hypothetical protein
VRAPAEGAPSGSAGILTKVYVYVNVNFARARDELAPVPCAQPEIRELPSAVICGLRIQGRTEKPHPPGELCEFGSAGRYRQNRHIEHFSPYYHSETCLAARSSPFGQYRSLRFRERGRIGDASLSC